MPFSPTESHTASFLSGLLGSFPHSLIIVSYNSASTIGACLHNVLLTLKEGDEVIVVDNASQDDTVKLCRDS
jgi:Glycosyl transferase family 2